MDENKMLKLCEDLAAAKQEHESFRRRLDEHDVSLKQLSDMTVALTKQGNAIENMSKTLAGVKESVDGVVARVNAIEKEPGDNAKKIAFEIIKYIVLAVLGVVVGYFIKG